MPSDYKEITEYNEDQLGKDTSSRKTQVSMYSDPTHFIYEILQNADDYGATEVLFKLSEDDIVIEHNGAPFKEENVRAITYFGKSTSREDLVKTGRFGIGFKSVFAFTATPIIISGFEHFQIYGLYRVREYPYPDGFSRSRTRIILPFDHESKQPDYVEKLMSKEEAYRQISKCLTELDMKTLLFMRTIREIRWEIDNQSECYSREDEVSDNSRLTTIKDGKHENTYLVFSKIPTWKNKEHKPVEIAFAVDTEHQLSPITDDTLHVLFPTRERTGLRFILNGPYRTNPARETISLADPFNIHLLMVTCGLMKELLPKLRNRKLLTLQFLSILPNEEDPLSDFYVLLRDTVVNEFRNTKLTPTKRGDHAAASGLYRVNTELSDLISDEDLAILLERKRSQPLWVANLPPRRRNERGQFVQDESVRRQNEQIDDFLTTLGISEWIVNDLVEVIENRSDAVVEWLQGKPNDWHRELYVLLGYFLSSAPSYPSYISRERKNKLSSLRIVRCSDNKYRIGSECHFPSDDDTKPTQDLLADATGIAEGIQHPHNEEDEYKENFHYVVKGVYSSGRSNDNEKAHKFLEDIGVREVNEAERIKLILKERYKDQIKPRDEDMEKFINLVEDEPEKRSLFKDYFIFEVDLKQDNKRWFSEPSQVFVDSPYLDTGLTDYHSALEEDSDSFKRALSPNYVGSGIDLKRIGEFAEAVGAQTKLEVTKQSIPRDHPEFDYLRSAPGYNWTRTGIDEDYSIPEFQILLSNPSIIKSKLVWQTMDSTSDNSLKSQFRWNQSYPTHNGDSTLVHKLKKAKWVPQKNGNSISFVPPRDASIERLPEGFRYDTGKKWLEVIEFGKTAKEQRLENIRKESEYNAWNQRAKVLGFDSVEEASTMAKIANDLKEQGKTPDELLKKHLAQKRRKELLIIELEDAEEKEFEIRARSIRSSRSRIEPKIALRAQYTTDENSMHCQMCSKTMPFKKRNSDEDYFDAVEALGKGYFFKEHEAQYLALCPECAAEYQEYVKRDPKTREIFYDALKNSDNPQIHVESNGRTIRIWFEDKHWQDLKTVLYYYENIYKPDDAD